MEELCLSIVETNFYVLPNNKAIMKKVSSFGIILMCLMGAVLSSCGDDESDDSPKTISIIPSSVNLYYEETQQLSASGATSWSSENDFVAEVDSKGLVTANHVGSTNILASNGNVKGKCTVTVKPKYNCYDTPLLNWGASKNAISAAETHTKGSSSSSNHLYYQYTNGTTVAVVQYVFENNALKGINVIAPSSDYASIGLHLLERYQPIGKDDDSNFYFIDSMDLKLARNVLSLSLTTISSSNYTLVTYIKNNASSNAPRRAISHNMEVPNEVLSILKNEQR